MAAALKMYIMFIHPYHVSQFGVSVMGVELFFFHLSPSGSKVTTLHLPLILCPKSSILALAHPSMHLITLARNLSLL